MRAKTRATLLTAVLAAHAPAQTVAWTQRLVSGPSARTVTAMAYDTARAVTVLFGGGNNGVTYNDTW